jgi:hypothetical protein
VRKELLERELKKLGFLKGDAGAASPTSIAQQQQQPQAGINQPQAGISHPQARSGSGERPA